MSGSDCLDAQFSAKCGLKTSDSDNKHLECVPMLLMDVKHCSASSPTFFEAFDGKVHFRTIMVHARIVGKLVLSKNNGHYKFEIDDNTSILPLFIPKKEGDILELQRLRNEVFIRKSIKENSDILIALEKLLNKTRKQLDPSRIAVGNKVFVFGRPDLFRGQVGVFGFSWDIDTGCDRTMELAFKDEIIDWYMNIYKTSKR
ncbi:PREDICTED: uncharacterized protein LOC108978271 [Bactrocera latifrons]|uniref:Uncharacterized protein n=1 Tax=Bactrocera latifrons TaxID=174628 RepID=A0A0K8V835_BACLA|nr:PREDICTED: uncharacterized protein LOC108978271 [Bactrocera latifrons]